jgi:cell division protein FtsX
MPGVHHLRKRRREANQLASLVSWIGMGLIVMFVMWTAAMVLLEAVDLWKQ